MNVCVGANGFRFSIFLIGNKNVAPITIPATSAIRPLFHSYRHISSVAGLLVERYIASSDCFVAGLVCCACSRSAQDIVALFFTALTLGHLVPVREEFNGETVRDGVVHVFDLKGSK